MEPRNGTENQEWNSYGGQQYLFMLSVSHCVKRKYTTQMAKKTSEFLILSYAFEWQSVPFQFTFLLPGVFAHF